MTVELPLPSLAAAGNDAVFGHFAAPHHLGDPGGRAAQAMGNVRRINDVRRQGIEMIGKAFDISLNVSKHPQCPRPKLDHHGNGIGAATALRTQRLPNGGSRLSDGGQDLLGYGIHICF